ncbi:MAG: DUF4345 domain-containing protein [Pseudomonadota bacterium]
MKALVTRVVLGLAGALLLYIGSAILIDPVSFAAGNGIALPESASLMSEVRAPAGLLVASAVLIIVSALRARRMTLALALSALVYGSYGLSRVVGILLDGFPSTPLTQAMVIELVIGAVSLGALMALAGQSKTPERR